MTIQSVKLYVIYAIPFCTSGPNCALKHEKPRVSTILGRYPVWHACVYNEVMRYIERQSKQVNYTQDSSLFQGKKEELPWVGFKPTTLMGPFYYKPEQLRMYLEAT